MIDTCNYGPERDGHIPELDSGSLTSSELLLRYIPDAVLVKAFNNIFFKHLRPGLFSTSAAMSGVAARTERIRVVPNVLKTVMRSPAIVAEQAASLNLLSGGASSSGWAPGTSGVRP